MKKQANQKAIFWALIFTLCFLISVFVLSKYSFSLPVAVLIIAVNALLFSIYTFKLIYSINFMDEVQIKIQLEGVSIAFVLSLLLVMTLGLIELIKKLNVEDFSFLYIFPLFFLFYFIGLFISNRRYR